MVKAVAKLTESLPQKKMAKIIIPLAVLAVISQTWSLDLGQVIVAPYADLLQQNIASTQLNQQINASISTILQNMANYDVFIANMTNQILEEHHLNIREKANHFKSSIRRTQRSVDIASRSNPLVKCLVEEDILEILENEINEQIKKCATVAMGEMVNVISDSLNEAQTFMTIPQVIGKDVQRCGLSNACRWDIVGHAIMEALQVPPKVFALTAKIQSIALRTVVSIDSCGIEGLRQIAETGTSVLGDIFQCISDEINQTNVTADAS